MRALPGAGQWSGFASLCRTGVSTFWKRSPRCPEIPAMSEKRPNLLVVEDEKNTRDALRRVLEDSFEVFTATDVKGAKKILETEPMDAVLTDLRLGNENGMEMVDVCRREHPPIPCVVMTAYGSVETAVEAMRKGAYDYVRFEPSGWNKKMSGSRPNLVRPTDWRRLLAGVGPCRRFWIESVRWPTRGPAF